jgi:hypothetical protein
VADRGNYEKSVALCVREVQQTDSPESRALLHTMAQAWTRMAEQSERMRQHDGEKGQLGIIKC